VVEAERHLVVAAVIRDGAGRLLVARRCKRAHLGGLWEFPGGAVENGEEPAAALVRELREELGIEARVVAPLVFAWHRDESRQVLLLFYETAIETGTPTGREGQEVRWVTTAELAALPTPPADGALIRSIVGEDSRSPSGG
jgi:8-oxo-dGTP diphosphatase